MLSFDTTAMNVYLIVVFTIAAIALVLSLGVVAPRSSATVACG